ncbi:TonB-dependent receptor [soil metagenome]
MLATSAILPLVLGSTAMAQTADGKAPGMSTAPSEASNEIGEVVVTANRRSQSILTVPMSITAVTAATLEKASANTFFDYATTVPNLSFGASGQGASGSRTIAIRGIADANTTGFYIDDTPVPDSLDPKIVDVDRIEVLRGPQGTLYGGRSEGGTVRLITQQPSTSAYQGRIHASVSNTSHADGANYQVDGAVNLPIIQDKIGLRISAVKEDEAGYFTREIGPYGAAPTKTIKGVGSTETAGVGASALIRLSDNLTVTPRVLYQRTKANGFNLADVTVADPLQSTILKADSLVQRRQFDVREGSDDKWLLGTFDVKYQADFGTFVSASSYFHRKDADTEDDSDWVDETFGVNLPSLITVLTKRNDFTQEFRFSSAFSGPLQIVSGLYYNRQRTGGGFPDNIVPGLDAATGGLLGTDLVFSANAATVQTEYAAYTEATYKLTDKATLIAGLRGFKVETVSSNHSDGIANGGATYAAPSKQRENGLTPKFTAQYQFTPQAQIYATAAKGFRPGGVNDVVPTAFGCDSDITALGLQRSQIGSYKSDSVWSYEAGGKGAFLDRKLRVDAAVYRIDWSNVQQNVSLACGFGFRGNAGSARSQGVELSMTAQPLHGLTLNTGFGYNDAVFTSTAAGTKFHEGDRVPQVPRYNASLSADYDFPVTDKVDGFVHADYKYTSNSTSAGNAVTDPDTGLLVPRIRPSYAIVDLRGGVNLGRYEVALFAKNVGDKRASLGDPLPVAVEAANRARVVVNQPRTIGLELRASF